MQKFKSTKYEAERGGGGAYTVVANGDRSNYRLRGTLIAVLVA